MSERPTNVQLVASFRALLTTGATDAFTESVKKLDRLGDGPLSAEDLLYSTKPWRAELWKAFNEIEERLCPLEVETRRRLKEKANGNS